MFKAVSRSALDLELASPALVTLQLCLPLGAYACRTDVGIQPGRARASHRAVLGSIAGMEVNGLFPEALFCVRLFLGPWVDGFGTRRRPNGAVAKHSGKRGHFLVKSQSVSLLPGYRSTLSKGSY